jgi:uncharacterized repeat protein (TIGR03803 family)
MQLKFCARGMVSGYAALVAVAMLGPVLIPSGSAQAKFKVLYSFQGGSDGATPQGSLLRDSAGNLYSTTAEGGINQQGTVFKVAPGGAETVLHKFDYDDGDRPASGLIADDAGNLYGTTVFGGAGGVGAVFELAPDGTETVLYSFDSNAGLGWHPSQQLIRDNAGNLYGTAADGRIDKDQYGTVFQLDTEGTFTLLYRFKGGADGAYPSSALLMDKAGAFYGTAAAGGSGYGVVFKITPDGAERVLYAFSSAAYGPAGLAADSAGNLYTSVQGGDHGYGAVFKLAADGMGGLLYSFKGGSDGAHPNAGLVLDKSGALYGTTADAGAGCIKRMGCGTIFEIAPDGTETVLHLFAGRQGKSPGAGLILDKKGNLYGTASGGGADHHGLVFRFSQ